MINSQINIFYLTTMDISRLQTDRSLSLLTHILFRANLPPELAFTRNTIANPPSASTSWRDLKIIFFYLKMLFVVISATLYKGSGKWQNDVIICAQVFTGSNHSTASQGWISLPTSTTTECLPMLNFLPIKLLCAFSFSFSSFLLWAGSPNIFFISENFNQLRANISPPCL